MKYGRYLTVGVVVVLCMTMISLQASAHPPRYMNLTYESNTLKVLVLHLSPTRSFHYVYRIDVEKNGLLVETQLYQTQSRFIFNTYSFNVTANSGDDITVIAYCVLFGSFPKSIVIP